MLLQGKREGELSKSEGADVKVQVQWCRHEQHTQHAGR